MISQGDPGNGDEFATRFEHMVANIEQARARQDPRRPAHPDLPRGRRPPPARGLSRAPARRCSPGRWPTRCRGSHARIQFTPDLLPSDVTGRDGLRPAQLALRLPPRRGLPQPPARRRDQPGLAQDAVGAARGDGGGTRHRRRGDARRAAAASWSSPRRTRSSRPAPTGCRRRSSTASSSRRPSATPTPSPPSRCCATAGSATGRRLVSPVVDGDTVTRMAAHADAIHVDDAIITYVRRLAEATREHPDVRVGLSPRGALALVRVGQGLGRRRRPRSRRAAGRRVAVRARAQPPADPATRGRLLRRAGGGGHRRTSSRRCRRPPAGADGTPAPASPTRAP